MADSIDIVDRAVDALAAAGIEALGQRIDRLTGKDGTVVRMMPPRIVATYFDGSRRIDCTLQVISKRLEGPAAAMEECDRAADALCAADLSSANGSYELADAAEPAERDGDVEELAVGTDSRHVWAARVLVRIIRY